jgi:hypothetical protein
MRQSLVPVVEEEEGEESDPEDTLPDDLSDTSGSDFEEAFAVDSDVGEDEEESLSDAAAESGLNEGFIHSDCKSPLSLEERMSFFETKSAELLSCRSFTEVREAAKTMNEEIATFASPNCQFFWFAC